VQRIEAKIDDGHGKDNGDAVGENDVTTVVLVELILLKWVTLTRAEFGFLLVA
jgi:hypothetical protein